MANEITVQAGLTYVNAAQNIPSISLGSTGTLVTITNQKYNAGLISLSTATGGTAIPMGNLGSLGWAAFKNIDTSGIIVLQSTAGAPVSQKLLPSEICTFRFNNSTAPFAFCTTCITGLTPNLEFFMLET